MATDFVHTGEIIDQIILALKGADGAAHTNGLPANWFKATTDANEVPLKLLEHGDLADYVGLEAMVNDLPAIVVRPLGIGSANKGALAGVLLSEDHIRVVHVRGYDQCRTDAGAEETNQTRARIRYATIISRALFADPHKRLAVIDSTGTRAELALTCNDAAGAQINIAVWEKWDLGADPAFGGTEDVSRLRALKAQVWAIACDLRVQVRTGGGT